MSDRWRIHSSVNIYNILTSRNMSDLLYYLSDVTSSSAYFKRKDYVFGSSESEDVNLLSGCLIFCVPD